MGIRGVKPHPTNLRLIKGNPGNHPINMNEPIPEPEMIPPPPHLHKYAVAEWERLQTKMYNLGLLSAIDRSALSAYCQAYARWVVAEEALSSMAESDKLTGGLMIKTKNGNAIQNPLVGTANKAMADMVRYAAEFGLTPSSRSRIDADASDRPNRENPARKYLRNRG